MVWSNDQANSLTFPPGATSGQRMTIDGNGILVYDSSNDLVFAITPGNNPPAHTGQAIIFGTASGGRGIESIETTGGAADTFLAGATVGGRYQIAALGGGLNTDFTLPQAGGVFIQPNGLTYERFQLGSGFAGPYYYEQTALVAGQAIANGVITQLQMIVPPGFVNNDFNPGVSQIDATGAFWTCPGTGIYEIDFYLPFTNGAGGAGQVITAMGHGVGLGAQFFNNGYSKAVGDIIAVPSHFKGVFNTGDLIYIGCFNGTGVNTVSANNRNVTFQRVL